jgi:kynurenine formamidase
MQGAVLAYTAYVKIQIGKIKLESAVIMTTFVDLSHVLEPGMPTYPGIPEMKFHLARPFRLFAVPPAIKGGTSFPVRIFALCE